MLTAWCIDYRHFELIAASPVVSRCMQAWACSLLPYALPDGGGTSVFFNGTKRLPLAIVSVVVAAAGIGASGTMRIPFVFIIASSLLPAALFFTVCRKRIGGLTGDALGAASEIAELSVLFFGPVIYSMAGFM